MSKTIELNAELRTDIGKGASRRLRRLQNKVPAIVYGGKQEPVSICLLDNQLRKAMEQEAFYSSLLKINLDSTDPLTVLVKAIQRHPFKRQVLHMDLLRVSGDDIIVKAIPLHFINEESSMGVKMGGHVSHVMNEIEVKCKVKDLPEYIEVDLSGLELNQILHLSDLKLPANTQLAADLEDPEHNLPVVSVHLPRGSKEESAEGGSEAGTDESAAGNKPE